jgi:hypothetical protein
LCFDIKIILIALTDFFSLYVYGSGTSLKQTICDFKIEKNRCIGTVEKKFLQYIQNGGRFGYVVLFINNICF